MQKRVITLAEDKPKIIVLSRNYSTGLGVIRSLGAAGYPVDLIASVKKRGSSIIASSSKYVQSSTEVLTTKIQGDSGVPLIEVLLNYPEYTGGEGIEILFPTDDFTMSVIDCNRHLLDKRFLMPKTYNERISIVDLMEKTLQCKLAEEVGLLVPKTWRISLREDICIPADLIYPCFVKPIQSISGHKNEMKACQNECELVLHLEKMKAFFDERDVLIQEFLYIDKEYDLSGVCLDEEIIIPAVIEKTKIAKFERGVTMSGKTISTDSLGDTKEKIEALLRKFRFWGMFDMELNLCGDKVYFNEINLRSGGPNFSYFLNGVNLPLIFVEEIRGKKHDREQDIMKSFGKTFIYEKVAWEDYIHGYITKAELKRYLTEADFRLLQNPDDPAPGKHFSARIRLSAIKQKIKKIIRR